MDTTSHPAPEISALQRSRVRRVKVLLIFTAFVLLGVSAYLYFTASGRLDREIFGEDMNFETEIASLPEEAKEVLTNERNSELLRRHAAFAGFGAVGALLLMMGAMLKRRLLLVVIVALLAHFAATGIYLFLAKQPSAEGSEKNFGGEEMTPEKKLIWAMIIAGFAGIIP